MKQKWMQLLSVLMCCLMLVGLAPAALALEPEQPPVEPPVEEPIEEEPETPEQPEQPAADPGTEVAPEATEIEPEGVIFDDGDKVVYLSGTQVAQVGETFYLKFLTPEGQIKDIDHLKFYRKASGDAANGPFTLEYTDLVARKTTDPATGEEVWAITALVPADTTGWQGDVITGAKWLNLQFAAVVEVEGQPTEYVRGAITHNYTRPLNPAEGPRARLRDVEGDTLRLTILDTRNFAVDFYNDAGALGWPAGQVDFKAYVTTPRVQLSTTYQLYNHRASLQLFDARPTGYYDDARLVLELAVNGKTITTTYDIEVMPQGSPTEGETTHYTPKRTVYLSSGTIYDLNQELAWFEAVGDGSGGYVWQAAPVPDEVWNTVVGVNSSISIIEPGKILAQGNQNDSAELKVTINGTEVSIGYYRIDEYSSFPTLRAGTERMTAGQVQPLIRWMSGWTFSDWKGGYYDQVRWTSSNPAVAEITEAYCGMDEASSRYVYADVPHVTAKAAGRATITAEFMRDGRITRCSALLVVDAATPSGDAPFKFKRDVYTMVTGDGYSFIDELQRLAPSVSLTGATFRSSNADTASVDSNTGWVIAMNSGTATISCTINGKTASCLVNVVPGDRALTRLTFITDKIGLDLSSKTPQDVSKYLAAEPMGATIAATYKSGSTAIATVDATGLVTPKKAGTTTITATSGEFSAVLQVVVGKVPQKARINSGAFTLKNGASKQLALTAEAGAYLGDVTWATSGPGDVDQSGYFTANGNGKGMVYATYVDVTNQKHTLSCAFTSYTPLQQAYVPSEQFVVHGDYEDFVVITQPEDPTYEYSFTVANPGIVKLYDIEGRYCGYYGHSLGTTTITTTVKDAAGSKKTFTTKVTVLPYIDSDYITFKWNDSPLPEYFGSTLELKQGATGQFTYAGAPNGAQLNWVSSNPAIATVDAKGKVKALNPGKCYIILSDPANYFSKAFEIKVYQTATAMDFVLDELVIKEGASYNVQVAFTPADAWDQDVKWSIADEGVLACAGRVEDVTGPLLNIIGVSAGTTTITATSRYNPSLTKTLNVKVVPATSYVPVTSVSISSDYAHMMNSNTPLVLAEGDTFDLARQLIITGQGGATPTSPNLYYINIPGGSNSNGSIAISADGKVTAVAESQLDRPAQIQVFNVDKTGDGWLTVHVAVQPKAKTLTLKEGGKVIKAINVANPTPGQAYVYTLDWAPVGYNGSCPTLQVDNTANILYSGSLDTVSKTLFLAFSGKGGSASAKFTFRGKTLTIPITVNVTAGAEGDLTFKSPIKNAQYGQVNTLLQGGKIDLTQYLGFPASSYANKLGNLTWQLLDMPGSRNPASAVATLTSKGVLTAKAQGAVLVRVTSGAAVAEAAFYIPPKASSPSYKIVLDGGDYTIPTTDNPVFSVRLLSEPATWHGWGDTTTVTATYQGVTYPSVGKYASDGGTLFCEFDFTPSAKGAITVNACDTFSGTSARQTVTVVESKSYVAPLSIARTGAASFDMQAGITKRLAWTVKGAKGKKASDQRVTFAVEPINAPIRVSRTGLVEADAAFPDPVTITATAAGGLTTSWTVNKVDEPKANTLWLGSPGEDSYNNVPVNLDVAGGLYLLGCGESQVGPRGITTLPGSGYTLSIAKGGDKVIALAQKDLSEGEPIAITPVANGATKITVTSKSNNKLKATIAVKVGTYDGNFTLAPPASWKPAPVGDVASLAVGQAMKLKITPALGRAAGQVVYSAYENGSGAVSVSADGTVRGLMPGVATVTVYEGAINKFPPAEKLYEIHVYEPATLSLNRKDQTVAVGQQFFLGANLVGGSTVPGQPGLLTFTTENKGVVRLDETVENWEVMGYLDYDSDHYTTVTAVKAGTEKVTVTNPVSGKTATIKVTVKATGAPAPTSVTTAKPQVTVDVGKTVALKAQVKPAKANQDLFWYVNAYDEQFLKVDSTGKITGLKYHNGPISVYAVHASQALAGAKNAKLKLEFTVYVAPPIARLEIVEFNFGPNGYGGQPRGKLGVGGSSYYWAVAYAKNGQMIPLNDRCTWSLKSGKAVNIDCFDNDGTGCYLYTTSPGKNTLVVKDAFTGKTASINLEVAYKYGLGGGLP